MKKLIFCFFALSAILADATEDLQSTTQIPMNPVDPCLLNNGGCEQNCTKVLNKNGSLSPHCVCAEGLKLAENHKSCENETSNSTPKWIWWKEIGIDSAKVLLYLLSIFFGGFLFVFVITKLCFRTKSPKYLLLDENETATSIQLEEKQLQFEDFKMLVQKS